MLLQSSQSYQTNNMLQQIDNFALVTIDMGTVHFNTNSGISIQGFYGIVNIKNTNIQDNYGCGLELAKSVLHNDNGGSTLD